MQETGKKTDTARLVELLRHQNVLYRRLRLLADRQKTLVAEDDAEPLLTLLAERQKLVDGLVGLNEQLSSFRENWTVAYRQLDEANRKCVTGLLEEANSALGSILQSDQQDTAKLAAKRQDIVDSLATVDKACRASAAYSTAGTRVRSRVTDAQA